MREVKRRKEGQRDRLSGEKRGWVSFWNRKENIMLVANRNVIAKTLLYVNDIVHIRDVLFQLPFLELRLIFLL